MVCTVDEDRGHAVMKAIVMQQPLISFRLLLKTFLLLLLLLLLTATYLSESVYAALVKSILLALNLADNKEIMVESKNVENIQQRLS